MGLRLSKYALIFFAVLLTSIVMLCQQTLAVNESMNCSNSCSYAGQRQCWGQGQIPGQYQICYDYNHDSCVEWNYPAYSCSAGLVCRAGNCIPTNGTLHITSHPYGAQIIVDNYINYGLTNKSIDLPVGNHKINLVKSGCANFTWTTTIYEYGNILSAQLLCGNGALEVKSIPYGANISIDGKSYGKTPNYQILLQAGPHELKLTASGYKDYIKNFTLYPRMYTNISAIMSRKTCLPAGYKCYDSKTVGYQNPFCYWSNLTACPLGCSNGKCIVPANAATDFDLGWNGYSEVKATFTNKGGINYTVPLLRCLWNQIDYGEGYRALVAEKGQSANISDYFVIENNGYSRVMQLVDVSSPWITIRDIGTGNEYDYLINNVTKQARFTIDGYTYSVLVSTYARRIILTNNTDDVDGIADLQSKNGAVLALAESNQTYNIFRSANSSMRLSFINKKGYEFRSNAFFCQYGNLSSGTSVGQDIGYKEGQPICDEDAFFAEKAGYTRALKLKNTNQVDKLITLQDLMTSDVFDISVNNTGYANIILDGQMYTVYDQRNTCIQTIDTTNNADGYARLVSPQSYGLMIRN